MDSNLTEVAVIIDKSGSMATVANTAIQGFNKFLEDQKKDPGQTRMTVVLFDDKTTVLVNGKDVQDVRPLSNDTYRPDGYTALYDAIGITMKKVGERLAKLPEEKRPGRVIIAVLTDGEENSSKEYGRQAVFDAIKHQEEKYSWTFMFLAAGMGAFGEAQNLGFSKGATVAFANNAGNTRAAYGAVSEMMTAYKMVDPGQLKTFAASMNLTSSYVSNGGEALAEASDPDPLVKKTALRSFGPLGDSSDPQPAWDWTVRDLSAGAGGSISLGGSSGLAVDGSIIGTTTGAFNQNNVTNTVVLDPSVQSSSGLSITITKPPRAARQGKKRGVKK